MLKECFQFDDLLMVLQNIPYRTFIASIYIDGIAYNTTIEIKKIKVLFSAGWGTKEAENVFSHCWGPDEIRVLQGGAG